MGKEQGLLDPVAFDAALAAYTANGSIQRPPRLADAIRAYLAAWNRRSSSDEAEVVAIGYRYRDNPDEPWSAEFWEYISPSKWVELRAKHRIFEPLYASPPGVKAGVTEARVEAAARALAARAVARVSPAASHIVDKGWIIYADDARAALTAALGVHDEGMGPDLLAELAKHVCWSIERGHEDSSDEEFSRYGWCVHEVSGNRSDREWRLISFGETPREALSRAIQGDAK